jgi:FlaA1/EpsC-like NDP-sugar epimerase
MPYKTRIRIQIVTAVCRHGLLAAVSLAAAFALRFDFAIPPNVLPLLWKAFPLTIVAKVAVYYLGHFHRSLRVYAKIHDIFRLLARNLLASALFAVLALAVIGREFPRSVYVIDFLASFAATVVVWFWAAGFTWPRPGGHRKRILIYGAGWAGATLLHEIRSNTKLGLEVAAFLDDDPTKRGADIMGVRVLGTGADAEAVVDRLSRERKRVEEIVIAAPSASGKEMREAVANCQTAGIRCRTIPGIADLLEREVLVSQIRDLSVADLLGRPQVQLDEQPIAAQVAEKCVLVTGAAGSIGGELCRQLAQFGPARLIALDQAESDLFRIENELRDKFADLDLVPVIGDIRNARRLADVFERNRIDCVFHAAAYKHVPMMESHILEAVENNILGTWNLVNTIQRYEVPRLLMISSDKAVNPSSVMGATKRACELIVAAASKKGGQPTCVSVRFGNVLGSNGSVVPIFQRQIATGGPVRVTHPDVQRYFMTIPESVSLVLQAFSMGTGSEIFVLDMGEPIRIVDLAVNMIRLAGLVPYQDIEIKFTGLRPGEKLFEEINIQSERMLPTYHEKIRMFQQIRPEWTAMAVWIERVRRLLDQSLESAVIEQLKDLVPEYHPSEKLDTLRKSVAGARPLPVPVSAP